MKRNNPITNHIIGASNCDGSILGFLRSRQTEFKYGKRETNFAEIYKLFASLTLVLPVEHQKTAATLFSKIESLEHNSTMMNKTIAEGELTMNTMVNAIEKITQQVEELINPPSKNPS